MFPEREPMLNDELLNPSQKRFLRATLGVIEDELRRLKGLLQEDQGERLFSHVRDDLTRGEKQLIHEKIDRLVDHLIDLKNSFNLDRSEFVLRLIVRAASAYLSIQLEGAMSDRLKGYGEISEDLKDALDPKLNEMISILHQVESVV